MIRVGDAAHSDRLRFVTALLEFAEQELRCVFFNKDAGFEVEARRHAEVFVSRSRVAVHATVFAAAVRVQARVVMNVWTVVVGEHRSARVAQVVGAGQARAARALPRLRFHLLAFLRLHIFHVIEPLEPAIRILGGTAPADRFGIRRLPIGRSIEWDGVACLVELRALRGETSCHDDESKAKDWRRQTCREDLLTSSARLHIPIVCPCRVGLSPLTFT